AHVKEAVADWTVLLDDRPHAVRVTADAEGCSVAASDKKHAVRSSWRPGQAMFGGTVDGRPVTIQVDRDGIGYVLTYRGIAVPVKVLPPRAAALLAAM